LLPSKEVGVSILSCRNHLSHSVKHLQLDLIHVHAFVPFRYNIQVAEEVAASAEAAMAAVKAARAIVDSEERSSSNSNSNNSEATAAVMQALETVQGLEAAVNTVSANLMYAT
jgi:hypothetical protein